MPYGLSLNFNSAERRPWSDAVRDAAEWSSREGPVFFKAQCKDLAQALFQETSAIAPTQATIAAKVESLGWRVIKRGKPSDWVAASYFRALKDKVLKKKRGRGARAINQQQEADFRAQKLDGAEMLAAMQKYVIQKRANARKYLASGWLGALVDLGGSTSGGAVDPERGGADISESEGKITVSLWNRTPGIVEQCAKHGIVEKAVATRILDLATYLNRQAAKYFRKAA